VLVSVRLLPHLSPLLYPRSVVLIDPRRSPFVLTGIPAQLILVGPRSCSPPLVRARLHYFAGPRFPLVCPCLVAPAGPCAHRCLFAPFAACSGLSPFVCWSLFVPARLCPLSCPTWLRLCGFRSCLLVFAWVHLGLFGFCLRLFGLHRAHLCFDWVLLGSKASRLCLYQMYVST
jgi:hypothetical protein